MQRDIMRRFLFMVLVICLMGCGNSTSDLQFVDSAKVWSPVTVTYSGPELSETRETFLDYSLDVAFVHEDGHEIRSLGYFAASGNAADDSSDTGKIWKVKFVPDAPGQWRYEYRFRHAPKIALNPQALHHTYGMVDDGSGEFVVEDIKLDRDGTDFRKKGMLQDVKKRYLQFSGTKDYFLKTGAGSPENLLAYSDFDGTYDVGGTQFPALGENQLHEFKPHLIDSKLGDPTWGDGKGASILGIANYYEEVGVNAQYLVTMNVEGDGQDVFPWTDHDDPYVFDVSKLAQWQRVFEHFNARGVLIDMLLTETENESWFEATDGAEVGVDFSDSRRLYYRELVARFGHLNGLVFNLGEENGVVGNSGQDPYRQPTTAKQRLAFAKYISEIDPYRHAIVSHNWPDAEEETYRPKVGAEYWSGVSLQAHHDYARKVKLWTRPIFLTANGDKENMTVAFGSRDWMVTVDEPLGWEFGAKPDAEGAGHRREIEGVLWPTLLAGGAGVDWYFGWQNNAATSDLSNEDQRSRDGLWRASKRVSDFMSRTVDLPSLQTTIVEDGTIIAVAKDKQGGDLRITLERQKPSLKVDEGHHPWEYEVKSLALERDGKVYWIDPMRPE